MLDDNDVAEEEEEETNIIQGRPARTEVQKVLEKGIGKLIRLKNAKFNEVVNALESQMSDMRPLDHLHIEKCYVETTLKTWLEESIERTLNYLEKETGDLSAKMSTLWTQLDSLEFLKNIRNLDAKSSKVLEWCSGERLQLILDQSEVFEKTRMSINLVSNYLKKFKKICTRKILSKWLDDKNYGAKHRHFIRKLNKFLSLVNTDTRRTEILSEVVADNQLNEDTAQELVQKLTELCHKYYLIDSDEVVADDKQLPPGPIVDFINCATQLSTENWTENFECLTKEMCKRQLLPSVNTVEYKVENGRRLIVVKGVAIFVNQMIDEMLQLKKERQVEEIQIVGLSSVHVDCDLEREDWHGINVSIVTDKLLIDKEVCWDVSGLDSPALLDDSKAPGLLLFNLFNKLSTKRNHIGENGEPGESGGNIYVICRKVLNAERWSIVSDGGDGSNGQNGDDEENATELREPREFGNKEEFHKIFPSMSSKSSVPFKATRKSESAMKVVLETLKTRIERRHRKHGADVGPDYEYGDFFVESKANKTHSGTTVSFYGARRERHTLILCKGYFSFVFYYIILYYIINLIM